ncbi:hypothetical protein [Streptomyces sp. HNM0574]|uniref:hypothetical protein n=1 Tax=Streptomyces sp. HNM0574 TaxID=2714954 RepID=UPI00146DFB91|nr:hypothetical protein [Streptomyces sp. HNM0574]NLU67900.1 hypothetical protein [Streptomyces sp. HNM0574]
MAQLDDAALVGRLVEYGVVSDFVRRGEWLVRRVARPMRGDIALCVGCRPGRLRSAALPRGCLERAG